jgi:hypothetical protein
LIICVFDLGLVSSLVSGVSDLHEALGADLLDVVEGRLLVHGDGGVHTGTKEQ